MTIALDPEAPQAQTPEPERPRGKATSALLVLSLGYLALMTFPGKILSAKHGVDPGWIIGVNRIPYSPTKFGRDVVFTSGPLQFLLNPLPIGVNLQIAAAFWVTFHAIFVTLVVYHARRARPLQVLAFVAAYAAGYSRGLLHEYQLLVLITLALAMRPKHARAVTPIASGFAAVLTVSKFSAGIAAFGLVLAASALRVIRRDWRPLPAFSLAFFPFLVILFVSSIAFMGGPAYLPRFLRGSWEISSGYASAVTVTGPALQVWYGAIATTVALAALVVRSGSNRTLALTGAALVPVYFMVFRHAYVRHQGRFLLPLLIVTLAVGILVASTRGRVAMVAAACAVVVGCAMLMTPLDTSRARPFWSMTALSTQDGRDHLAAIVRLGATMERSRAAADLERDVIPPAWVKAIREAGSVDVVPSEIGVIEANDLPWRPNPVLQLYVAYTPYLDAWSASHYASASSPAYVIAGWGDFDGRHPIMGAPLTWRSIFDHYRPVQTHNAFTLLQKKAPAGNASVVARNTVRIGTWQPVPADTSPLFVRLQFRPTLRAKLSMVAWRIPPVFIDLQYREGAVKRWRIVPATAQGGLLINYPPGDRREFVAFLNGRLPRRVDRFRITGPGAGYYDGTLAAVWERAAG